MTEQWRELKETITELRDNDGTGTQQEVCKFLANYMSVLESKYAPKRGTWIEHEGGKFVGFPCRHYECDRCHKYEPVRSAYCPHCGADMRGDKE